MRKTKIVGEYLLFMLLCIEGASAYNLTEKHGQDSFISDINHDGNIETISLLKKKSDIFPEEEAVIGVIKIESAGKEYTIGIEEFISPDLCGIYELVVSPGVKSVIAVSTHEPGTPHTWAVYLYDFDGKEIKYDGEIFSDCFSIEIKDVEDDGENEIVFESRDYEHNTAPDRSIYTVKYVGSEWKTISRFKIRTGKDMN